MKKKKSPKKNDFYSRVSFHQASTKSQAYARFLKLLWYSSHLKNELQLKRKFLMIVFVFITLSFRERL